MQARWFRWNRFFVLLALRFEKFTYDFATFFFKNSFRKFYLMIKLRYLQKIQDWMKSVKTALVTRKQMPVIIGEWGTSDVDDPDPAIPREDKLKYAEAFVRTAKRNGFATFYWMGLTDGTYRILPKSQADSEAPLVLISAGDSTPSLGTFDMNSDNCKWMLKDYQ